MSLLFTRPESSYHAQLSGPSSTPSVAQHIRGKSAQTSPKAPDGNYFLANIPDAILEVEVKDSTLFVDILDAGVMAGTDLSHEEAKIAGKLKNHTVCRVHYLKKSSDSEEDETHMLQFSMDITGESVASNLAQYGSYRGGDEGNNGDRFSDFKLDKPVSDNPSHDVPNDADQPLRVTITEINNASTHLVSSLSDGGSFIPELYGKPGEGEPVNLEFTKTIDPSTVALYSPSVRIGSEGSSTYSFFIENPASTEGKLCEGNFIVKDRDRKDKSKGAVRTFELELRKGTTFGDIVQVVLEGHFLPFFFRKLGVVYLGCRDFMSQFLLALQDVKVMVDGLCRTRGDNILGVHICKLLCYRYTSDLMIENKIDRGVWPPDSIDRQHYALEYKWYYSTLAV